MSQNLASLNLTDAELKSLSGALTSIRTILGSRAVSLDPDQRQSLVKMGDGSRSFCEQAVAALNSNAAALPPAFELAELTQDMQDHARFATFIAEYAQLAELLGDTQLAISSDIMTNSILGVGMLKVLNKLDPSLDQLLNDLRNVRRRKGKKPPTPGKP